MEDGQYFNVGCVWPLHVHCSLRRVDISIQLTKANLSMTAYPAALGWAFKSQYVYDPFPRKGMLNHIFSWSQCPCMAGRLSPNMAGNSSRCVCSYCCFLFFAKISTGLTIVHFCKLHIAYSCMPLKLNRDAVATDIVHQHSGRLDYYKGFVKKDFVATLSWRIIFQKLYAILLYKIRAWSEFTQGIWHTDGIPQTSAGLYWPLEV